MLKGLLSFATIFIRFAGARVQRLARCVNASAKTAALHGKCTWPSQVYPCHASSGARRTSLFVMHLVTQPYPLLIICRVCQLRMHSHQDHRRRQTLCLSENLMKWISLTRQSACIVGSWSSSCSSSESHVGPSAKTVSVPLSVPLHHKSTLRVRYRQVTLSMQQRRLRMVVCSKHCRTGFGACMNSACGGLLEIGLGLQQCWRRVGMGQRSRRC
mmetsp:Transcript_18203/g.45924  ORF Transcript_18203/g.45924 Transcript_18203/m.45924 type:complete len:214 (-) Transcript_18203:288-929(-)